MLASRLGCLAWSIVLPCFPAAAANYDVDVSSANEDLSFTPRDLTIHAGDTVTWHALGTHPHNVVEKTGAFRCAQGCDREGGSGEPSTGWTFSRQFTATGTVDYYCELHQFIGMTGSIVVQAAAPATNHTALWWNPNESGWGINFDHQGDIVFGTLFTYDAGGNPLWLVMSDGARQSGETFAGTLYRTTGPAFNAQPFTPIGPSNLTVSGQMTVTFSGDTAALTYTYNGTTVDKNIQKQVFGARAANCTPTTLDRSGLANYQDLWWNANESGWGINITHQDDTLFATLFTYDAAGNGLWLVVSAARRQSDGSYLGDLYQTTGPAFNAQPFTPIGPSNLAKVGTMQFRFANGTTGSITYSVNGVVVTKSITRQVFSSPLPACS